MASKDEIRQTQIDLIQSIKLWLTHQDQSFKQDGMHKTLICSDRREKMEPEGKWRSGPKRCRHGRWWRRQRGGCLQYRTSDGRLRTFATTSLLLLLILRFFVLGFLCVVGFCVIGVLGVWEGKISFCSASSLLYWTAALKQRTNVGWVYLKSKIFPIFPHLFTFNSNFDQ